MSHRYSRADGLTPKSLHDTAANDMKAAEILLKADASLTEPAAYLAHRAIGLLFKAWLLESEGEFKDKYELSKLYGRVQERPNAPQLSAIEIDALVKLGNYGGLPRKEDGDDAADEEEPLNWDRVRSLFKTLAGKVTTGVKASAAA
jgi:HEPN domain-containing protein